MLQILQCFQNVANIAETLKMLQIYCRDLIKNVANVTEPSKCCKYRSAVKILQILQRP